jgi:hypothetical protein
LVINLGFLLFLFIPHPSFGAASTNQMTLEQAKAQLEAGKATRALETVEELIDSLPPPEILQEAYFLQATILQQNAELAEAISVVKPKQGIFPGPHAIVPSFGLCS